MTINRDSMGEIVIDCDGDRCDEVLYTETDDFERARVIMKGEGWRAKKEVDDQWYHLCPKCND